MWRRQWTGWHARWIVLGKQKWNDVAEHNIFSRMFKGTKLPTQKSKVNKKNKHFAHCRDLYTHPSHPSEWNIEMNRNWSRNIFVRVSPCNCRNLRETICMKGNLFSYRSQILEKKSSPKTKQTALTIKATHDKLNCQK